MTNRLIAVSFALLTTFALAAAAYGQAAKGHGIPDPITTAELDRYADRLMLSHEQRAALQPLHDEYRERFRALRESTIDRYLEESQADGRRASPGNEAWRQTQPQRDRILAQISAIDEQLFSEIEAMLSDEQREVLPRVRLARLRARAMPMVQLALIAGFRVVDLSEVLMAIDMTAAEREAIDPILHQYEQRLTRMLEEFPPIMVKSREESRRAEQEMRPLIRANPDQRDELLEQLIAQTQAANLPPQERMVAMRALGRDTVFTIGNRVSDRTARLIRSTFIQRAYWEERHYLGSRVEPLFDDILAREDLTESHREQIADRMANLRRRIDAIAREALEATDEREARTTIFHFDRLDTRDKSDMLKAYQERIRQADDAVIGELVTLLPEEAAQHVVKQTGWKPPAERAAAAAQAAAEQTTMPLVFGDVVPRLISQTEVAEYARLLGLDDDEREVVAALREEYETRTQQRISTLREEAKGPFTPGVDDLEQVARRASEARTRALTLLAQADESFFNELAGALPHVEDRMERVGLMRERRRYTISPRTFTMMGAMSRDPMESGPIDLAHLARRQSVDLGDNEEADAIFLEYERELTRFLRERFDLFMQSVDLSMVMFGRFREQEVNPGAEEPHEESSARFRASSEIDEQLQRNDYAIEDLNNRAIDELQEALPRADAEKLRMAYLARAYPVVYNDPGAMEAILAQTLRMEDLTPNQRERIAELLAEYKPQYADLTERLAETTINRERWRREWREARWRGDQPQRPDPRMNEEYEKIRHERQELSARAIATLRSILSETQLARLGTLPNPAAQPRPAWLEDGMW